MALQKFTPGDCCGCEESDCEISADEFTGSGSVGAEWDAPLSGTWARSGDKLVTSSANAKILNVNTESFGSGFGGSILSVTVGSATIGAQAVILYRWNSSTRYSWVRWEFADGEGILTIWDHNSGVDTQGNRHGPFFDEPAEFHFPGRGAGVDTDISVCFGDSGMTVTVDDGHGFRSGPSHLAGATGLRAGLGTAATGGDVTFDNFLWQHSKAVFSNCPDCLDCQSCSDDALLCIAISGTCDSLWNDQTHVVGPRLACLWALNHTLVVFGVPTLLGRIEAVIYRDEDDLHYYLEVRLYDAGLNLKARYRKDLGEDNPDCTTFDGEVLPWLEGDEECDYPTATVTVTSGEICQAGSVSEDEVCCEDTDLPESLYVTDSIDGASLGEDVEFVNTHPGFTGFEFDQVPPNTLGRSIRCDFSGGAPAPGTAVLISGGSIGNVDLTVHSCSPFHATGTKAVGSSTYIVEVTQ